MKKILLIIFLFLLASCESEKKDVVSIPVSVPERKLEVLYKTTDTYGSRMFSVPGGKENQVILRIKGGTKLKVLEIKQIQMGTILGNWYKVKYDNKTGWVSGFTLKEGEELIIPSEDDKIKNYEKQIGKKPESNPWNGKITIVDEWIKKNSNDPKSIDYLQWYQPFAQNDYWVCRVEFTVKNAFGGLVREDILFHIKYGEIIAVVDKIGTQLY
jgi:hypothetical protein